MPHVFEPAASGRSKCRGCGRALQRGEIRFGESIANPYAEGTDLMVWFHPVCAAYKRPEPLLEALAESTAVENRDALEALARATLAHERLRRVAGAEHAKGVATCRHCRGPIERGSWRLRLSLFDEGMLNPLGFIHVACSSAYFENADVVDATLHFSPDLDEGARAELRALMAAK